MQVGTVRELWRYPFKSMGGERLDGCTIGRDGIVGDRGRAVRDEAAGEIRGAKKLSALLGCRAQYVTEPRDDTIPPVTITLRDGAHCRSDEPLPDLSVFPPEVFEYTSPLGTYFDAFPLHVLTTAWLAALARRNPAARFDVRRLRLNVLIAPAVEDAGEVELDWIGRTLRIGQARVTVGVPCPRCVMTTLPQGDLPKDPGVLRTIVRDSAQNVGVYVTVGETAAHGRAGHSECP